MTENEAWTCVGVLAAVTPGPWNDDVVTVWANAFAQLDDADLLHATIDNLVLHWTSDYRPTLGQVIEAYDARRRFRLRELLPSTTHCDGSGWVPDGATYRPCGRCNPALAQVYRDHDKLAAWRAGVPLWTLDVGVERKRNGQLRYVRGEPPTCHVMHDDGVLSLNAAVGIDVAKAAYEAEVTASGRKPKRERFERMAAAVTEVGPTNPRRKR